MAMIGRLITFQAANPNMFLKQIGEVIMKKALSLIMVFMVAVAFSATGYSADKYVSAAGGIAWFDDMEVDHAFDGDWPVSYGPNFPVNPIYILGVDSGITLIGAFGCDYGDYRIEGEMGYQSGDLSTLTLGESGWPIHLQGRSSKSNGSEDSFDMVGDLSILTLMANAYYDIDLGGVEISPFVGVGGARVSVTNVNTAEDYFSVYDYEESDSEYLPWDWSHDEVAFAGQVGVVVGIPVSDNIMLDARYRYFATTMLTFTEPFTEWANPENDGGMSARTSVQSHSALLGLRVGL